MFNLIAYFNVSILINFMDLMKYNDIKIISVASTKLRKIVIDIWALLNLTWLQNTLFTVKVKIYDKLCTHTSLNIVVLEATDDLQDIISSSSYDFNLILSHKTGGIIKIFRFWIGFYVTKVLNYYLLNHRFQININGSYIIISSFHP